MVELKLELWGVPIVGDRRVPGAWITGDRGLDMLVFPFLFAALFPLLRMALERLLYRSWAERVLEARLKKGDEDMGAEEQAKFLAKWCESAWKATAFGILTLVAFSVSVTEPWFTDPHYFWKGASQFPLNFYVPRKLLVCYFIEAGFYLQAIPYLAFIEQRRSDWAGSMAHHFVTVALIYYSFYANFCRPGVIVMQLHDVSDIFLELAKLYRYSGRQKAAEAWFALFAASWVYLRIWVYPRMIVFNCLRDPVALVAMPYNIDPQPHYSAFGSLFTVLFFLHVYWTYFILRIVVLAIVQGEAKDVREDDDD